MLQPVGQIAVVGQQEQPFGIAVQPAHREDARARRQERAHGSRGVRIPKGGGNSGRLVELVQTEVGVSRDGNAVHRHATASVVELPAGRLRPATVARHVAAVLAVARG